MTRDSNNWPGPCHYDCLNYRTHAPLNMITALLKAEKLFKTLAVDCGGKNQINMFKLIAK